jgi:putative membrane protein
MHRAALLTGVAVLAAAWLGPLPGLAPQYFSAHMTMHMAIVAVAAPLIALGIAGTSHDLTRRVPALFSPIPASLLELIVVWAWHAPVLHHFARSTPGGLAVEQAMFFASGLLVWLSAFGSEARRSGPRAGAGVVALLLTSMHMTLLGALLALAPRALYVHAGRGIEASIALDEQHLGGAIMLAVGGLSYLAGGLWLSARLLRLREPAAHGGAA